MANSTKQMKTGEAGDMARSIEMMQRQFETLGLGYANMFGKAWLEGMSEMGAEFTQLLADRIREDVRTQHAILNCKDPTQLTELRKSFFERAVSDYSAQSGKMMEIGGKMLERIQKAERAN